MKHSLMFICNHLKDKGGALKYDGMANDDKHL